MVIFAGLTEGMQHTQVLSEIVTGTPGSIHTFLQVLVLQVLNGKKIVLPAQFKIHGKFLYGFCGHIVNKQSAAVDDYSKYRANRCKCRWNAGKRIEIDKEKTCFLNLPLDKSQVMAN